MGGDAPAYDEAELAITAVALDVRKRISAFLQDQRIPLFPDMGIVTVWLKRGVAPSTIIDTVCEGFRPKPSISSLKYFENPVTEAHALASAPAPKVVPNERGPPKARQSGVLAALDQISDRLREQEHEQPGQMLKLISG